MKVEELRLAERETCELRIQVGDSRPLTVRAEDPTDIFYVPDFQDTKLRFEDIARIPVVAAAYDIKGFPVTTPALQDLEVSAPVGDDCKRLSAPDGGAVPPDLREFRLERVR